jgi:integrase
MIKKVYSKRQKKEVWSINLTVDNCRIRQSGFATKDEAEDAVAAIRLRQRARRLGLEVAEAEITLAELLKARKKDKTCTSSRNRERLLSYFDDFVHATDPQLPVRSVGLSHLRAFRDSLSHQKPSTIKFKMAGVVGSLNAAPLYFPALENYRAPRLKGPRVPRREVLVPRDEFKALLAALRTSTRPRYPETADLLEMLALTGARIGEILSLTRQQIDWERELLTLHASKTKTTKPVRFVPITGRMRIILERWRFGFVNYNHAHALSIRMRVNLKIGIPPAHWRIHDIRHTTASQMAEAGVSQSIIAEMLGHTLGGTTARYTHATMPALRQAALVLERWCADDPAVHLRAVN